MHGGDIYRNRIDLDFSINVNPLGVPDGVRAAMVSAIDSAAAYPDIRYEKLRKAIGNHYGCNYEEVICGNGASELILAVCRAVNPRKVMLFAPCFTGYENAISSGEADIIHYYLNIENEFSIDDEIDKIVLFIENEKPDLIFLTNPNNPNGLLTKEPNVDRILKACKKAGAILVLDECFKELTAKSRMHRDIEKGLQENKHKNIKEQMLENKKENHQGNLLILSAFTKTYAIPGIRLGFVICRDMELRERIEKNIAEWNISCVAEAAGIAALGEEEYLQRAMQMIRVEREYLTKELKLLGFTVFKSDSNFILFCDKIENQSRDSKMADSLWEGLLKEGILIRDCSDYKGLGKGYYRVCVRSHEENQKLVEMIHEIRNAS